MMLVAKAKEKLVEALGGETAADAAIAALEAAVADEG